MEVDILKLAANAYHKLLNVEYHIVLGRKGKSCVLDIVFREDNFYHLAGLHKLKNSYSFQQHTSSWVLKHVVNGDIDTKTIEKDINFNLIFQRLQALSVLEQIMDASGTKFYSYDDRKVTFATKIKADYLAKGNLQRETIVYSFFVKADSKYCMNSIFNETNYDYSTRQTQYTVLLKQKSINDGNNIAKYELFRHNKFHGV